MHVQIKKSQESRFDSDCTYGSHRCWIYIYMAMQSAWCTVKPNVTKYFSDLRMIDDKFPPFHRLIYQISWYNWNICST